MAVRTIDDTLERLRRKAASDGALAEVLELLAADDVDDSFAEVSGQACESVRDVNRRRMLRHRAAVRHRAFTTAEVVDLIDTISDRKAVDRRRQRGRLLGVREGRTILHPAWQFDLDRRETRLGLDRVLAALAEVAPESLAADAIMTVPRADLDGGTIAQVFEGGNVDLGVQLIRTAGDQS